MNENFTSIIDRWPSRGELAADLGVPMERVKKWAQRNRIPSEYWASLLLAADGRGISLNSASLIQAAHESSRAEKAA